MSPASIEPPSPIGPNDPPPQEDPTHDVPVYPEQDPPQGTETDIRVAAGPGGPGVGHEEPKEVGEDIDEDDMDPQATHSPADVGKAGVIFDENEVAR